MPCCMLVLLEHTCPGEAPALGVVTSSLITRHWCGDQVNDQPDVTSCAGSGVRGSCPVHVAHVPGPGK